MIGFLSLMRTADAIHPRNIFMLEPAYWNYDLNYRFSALIDHLHPLYRFLPFFAAASSLPLSLCLCVLCFSFSVSLSFITQSTIYSITCFTTLSTKKKWRAFKMRAEKIWWECGALENVLSTELKTTFKTMQEKVQYLPLVASAIVSLWSKMYGLYVCWSWFFKSQRTSTALVQR
jgi:hypothetical protein